MPNFLKEFFVVTSTSLYRIYIDEADGNKTVMIKMALRQGVGSKRPVGSTAESLGDNAVIISKECIQFWQCLEDDAWRPIYTSSVVALFLDQNSALSCLREQDLRIIDERWKVQTLKVLRSIDNNHPSFVVRWDSFPEEYISTHT